MLQFSTGNYVCYSKYLDLKFPCNVAKILTFELVATTAEMARTTMPRETTNVTVYQGGAKNRAHGLYSHTWVNQKYVPKLEMLTLIFVEQIGPRTADSFIMKLTNTMMLAGYGVDLSMNSGTRPTRGQEQEAGNAGNARYAA